MFCPKRKQQPEAETKKMNRGVVVQTADKQSIMKIF